MPPAPSKESYLTGLPALDQHIVPQGFSPRSLNVIGGSPGTGKTVLALQTLFANARPDHRAIYFTTISEPTVKFLSYLQKFDFYDAKKMFTSIVVRDIGEAIQTQPLPQVIDTINRAINEEQARIVVIDSFKAISDIVPQADLLRIFAYNLAVSLVGSMCTAFLVGEYTETDMTTVPIFAIADGIVMLSFLPEGLNRQRYLEVHKVRGRPFVAGMHPFQIGGNGITVYPRLRTPDEFVPYIAPTERVTTGLPRLDEMLDGGIPAGSVTMVAGGAGTGKTLIGMHFIAAGIARGEPAVIVTFQEDPVQLGKIANSFGWNLAQMERDGLLLHLYNSPVEIQPDIHTSLVKQAVERIGAKRVMVDSLKDLEIATPNKVRYKDYIYSLVNDLKTKGVTTLVTNEIPELFGPFQLSEYGVSFIADNVALLRYVEMDGQIERAISVLKARGSQHSKAIYRFQISSDGINIGQSLRALTGILAGTPISTGQPNGDNGGSMLSPEEQYIWQKLNRSGPSTDQELAQITQLPLPLIQESIARLVARGSILPIDRDGITTYSVSMR